MTETITKNKLLQNICERLPVDEITFKKAEEFFRVYHHKTGGFNLNDIAKGVLCLDLAASVTGSSFDKETALKLSGLKSNIYTKNLNTVTKLLNLDKKTTIAEVCVQFSCTEVKELAQDILKTYTEKNIDVNLSHPQYVTTAVYTACKMKGVRVSTSQFRDASLLARKHWLLLVAKFRQIVDIEEKEVKKKKRTQSPQAKKIAEHATKTQSESEKYDIAEPEVEEYEVWKTRILNEAYKAIKINT